MGHRALGGLVVLLVLLSGATALRLAGEGPGGPAAAVTIAPGVTDAAPNRAPESSILGIATYYGNQFHGRTMANGRPFDMDNPAIAASNRWPLGTRLTVRRLPNSTWDSQLTAEELAGYRSRTIQVVVSDHGAFDHELDLSAAAFALLGRPEEGVIRVAVEATP